MPPKRKNDNEQPTWRDRKKQKMSEARAIAFQTRATSSNAIAGPSNSATTDSMIGLPGALDVERFAEARAFEINAMQEAMVNVKEGKSTRVWQDLPRHLRRRAASHDVRRVPLRLRDKAKAEMDEPKRKQAKKKKSQPGKEKRTSRTESLLRRQYDKTWLESHIWHAKRMHMDNMWGYRLAITPTEKAFRPSHRASVHGSILHDASYYSLIELKGPESLLKTLLEGCCDPQGSSPGAKGFLTGTRILETHIYKYDQYPFDLIAPITIMWRPLTPTPASGNAPDPNTFQAPSDGSAGTKSKGSVKGKEKAHATSSLPQAPPNADIERILWIRSHPSVFDQVFSTLKEAASRTLTLYRKRSGKEYEIDLSDLREQVNVFEIVGPKASQVIKGALKVVQAETREEFKKFWSELGNIQSSGSVPRGMAIGFKVYDPRLSFPPKNAKVQIDSTQRPSLKQAVSTLPSSALAHSEIWDEDVRKELKKPRFKKKDLDARKSENLVPGQSLRPLSQDDRVPVLLIQHSVENASTNSPGVPSQRIPNSDSNDIHGWTLVVPSGWGMPFLMSLIHTGTRVGGQRERQVQSFEAGQAYFPRDYPSTDICGAFEEERARGERETWEKKPPQKRANWEKIGTRSPFRPDWEVVLGLKNTSEEEDLIPAQREDDLAGSVDSLDGPNNRPWLFRGTDVPNIIDRCTKMLNPDVGLLAEINNLRVRRNLDMLPGSLSREHLLKGALVTVKVVMCRRGAPGDLAAIYGMENKETWEWFKLVQVKRNRQSSDEESTDEIELSKNVPPPDSIIGYVTTGNFSLSRGQGYAIGAISLASLFQLHEQSQRLRSGCLLVKVRDRQSPICRAAYLQVVDA